MPSGQQPRARTGNRIRQSRRTDPGRISRALSQRIHLLSVDDSGVFQVVGSTGDTVYEVKILPQLDCECPDARIRHAICKHMVFVWVRVLRLDAADIENEIDEELSTMIQVKMMDIPQLCYYPMQQAGDSNDEASVYSDKPLAERRSLVDNTCPVCLMDFDEGGPVLWCSRSCGHNIHEACWVKWKAHKSGNHACVICRQLFVGGK